MITAPASDGVNRAFFITYLLTADHEQAEAAVINAIESFDPAGDLEQGVVRAAIRTAVRERSPGTPPNGVTRLETCPPPAPEIQAVLNLAPNLRHCFVLRILAGCSRRLCARLLRLSTRAVDEYTCAALRRLAEMGRC